MLSVVMRRRALAVGASSEIGTAVAVDLAVRGHDLVVWGLDEKRLHQAADRCRAVGGASSVGLVDVTDRARLRQALDSAAADGPLHVVVWAAGVFDWARADQADPEVWQHVMDVNLTAAAVFTALVLRWRVGPPSSCRSLQRRVAASGQHRSGASSVSAVRLRWDSRR